MEIRDYNYNLTNIVFDYDIKLVDMRHLNVFAFSTNSGMILSFLRESSVLSTLIFLI